MRISSDQLDRAYHPCAGVCKVFLDGAERNNVITADEEGRVAVTYRLDERGAVMYDEKTGLAKRDTFTGSVRVECPGWLRQECEGRHPHTDVA